MKIGRTLFFLIGFILSGCSRHCLRYEDKDCDFKTTGVAYLSIYSGDDFSMIKRGPGRTLWAHTDKADYFNINISSDHIKFRMKEGNYEIKKREWQCLKKCVEWTIAWP